MPDLLDLMSPEAKAKAIARGKRRLERKPGATVSPELFIVAEFGYYFGWDAILAIKRGYIDKVDDDGALVKEPFTLEEALALLEAAKKVWYGKVVETGHAQYVASASKFAKSPRDAFSSGMKPFSERADMTQPAGVGEVEDETS